ncbi:MAG: outer membrane protein assembly factor BamC [Gammaproteobacteria bacterium]|nr:outer membrane protein assembly factor BamC [Gammaproteobacteria bacterium]MDH5593542.1 outer membrane protein assembly factor BamC [Gammaproteobacteria bacterium]MDH5614530.1 outer membrane protein assembly factor BamC [Gammaproteobacteria bacterium]
MNVFRILISFVVVTSLVACSTLEKVKEGRDIDYKKSRTAPSLEVPPDLTTTTIDDTMVVPDINVDSTASYSDYTSERSGTQAQRKQVVLPLDQRITVKRDGDKRWLVVVGAPDELWEQVREFWLQMGFLIKMEDARLGIIETDWHENRADIPEGPIRSFLSKALDTLYSADTRDKFRVRLERGAKPGTTEIFFTHRGAQEVNTSEQSGPMTAWQPRPSDPELEIEMMTRFVSFIGIEEKRARTMVGKSKTQSKTLRAKLVRSNDGSAQVVLEDDFPRAWRRTGIALDRVGFTVEDRDRSKGLYFVRYIDPEKDLGNEEGWLSSLAFWSSDDEAKKNEYTVSVSKNNGGSAIAVLDKSGARDSSGTAQRILSLLHDQLK